MNVILGIAVIILFIFIAAIAKYLIIAIEKINEFNKKIKAIEQDIITLKFRIKAR